MSTVVVTGGAGFIGSHLCRSLLARGHEVVCLDNFTTGSTQNVSDLLERESFHCKEVDVRQAVGNVLPDGLRLGEVSYVYHLASRASPADFEEWPVKIATTNAEGTHNMLSLAKRADARFLFASTSEVYGDPEVHPQPEEYNGNVNLRGPRACYDEGKRYAESLIEAFSATRDVETRTARLFNTYGPQMRADDGRVIPTFVSQSLRGADLTVHGDGQQTRSFLYVDDLVRGLIDFMELDSSRESAINLGSTNEMSIKELAETVIDVTDSDSDIVYTPRPTDDPDRRRPDVSRAERVLDWSPRVTFTEGIQRLVPEYQSGRDHSDG
jgi:UDP-glucuronate decarboxylase